MSTKSPSRGGRKPPSTARMRWQDPDAFNLYVWGEIDPYPPLWKVILKWIGIGALIVVASLISLFVLAIVTHWETILRLFILAAG